MDPRLSNCIEDSVQTVIDRAGEYSWKILMGKSIQRLLIIAGVTDIGPFLESFAHIEIQFIIRSTLDQSDNIYGLEHVRDNP